MSRRSRRRAARRTPGRPRPLLPAVAIVLALLLLTGFVFARSGLLRRGTPAAREALPPPEAVASAVPVATTPTPSVSVQTPLGEVAWGNRARRQVALTFDCGPWTTASTLTPILDALEKDGLRLTFFVTGQFIEQQPALFQRIAVSHELANHGYTHADLTTLTEQEALAELEDTERLARRHGFTTKPYWRAPSGARNATLLARAAEGGWPTHVFWSVQRVEGTWVSGDAGDWQQISADEVLERLLHAVDTLGNGIVTVQHCTSPQTASILPQELARLRARGFAPTTVSGVLSP